MRRHRPPARFQFTASSALVASALVCAGCLVDRTIATVHADGGSTQFDDGGTSETPDGGLTRGDLIWGESIGRIQFPQCPAGATLVVNTTNDELEGGTSLRDLSAAGAFLSLREALFIAANRGGTNVIRFDPLVFQPKTAAVISVTDEQLRFPPNYLQNTCLDARDRTVIVTFAYDTAPPACASQCMWGIGAGSMMIGFVIIGNGEALRVLRGTVIGNRFAVRYRAIEAYGGSVIGPWNTFGAGTWAFATMAGATEDEVTVNANFIGYDPMGDERGQPDAVALFIPAHLLSNRVHGTSLNIVGNGGRIHDNQLHDGASITLLGHGWTVGPDNVIEGSILNIPATGGNRIQRNVIDGTIVSDGPQAQIGGVDGGTLSGTCSVDGDVEAYAKSGTIWSPLGLSTCASGLWHSTPGNSRSGMEVGVLFTDTATNNTGTFSPTVTLP